MVYSNVCVSTDIYPFITLNKRNSTISSAQREGISRFVDDQFDQAYNLTQEAGDLKHVKWGRIDYMNVTALTTKWSIWRCVWGHLL